ncbi:HAD family hydrolase [Halorhabdus rudnickae]|uniref:HAD family hydrolase n=1 Tax=Halorhabdus rudnickae TaxID=1775544 RepID=UPI001082EED0|nr:HAD family hydrolase [Halorhabdus rudnickae]
MVESYEAVVYDLDGTLVELDVDWALVTREVADRLENHGVATDGATLWNLLKRADAAGVGEVAEELVATHERVGAHTSERLPLADELPLSVPVGVCSLNAETAVRMALERHGLVEAVEAVVGRDSLAPHKPQPEPLLAVVSRLGVDPAETLFVGDSETDEITAERAGTAFQYVEERLGE